MTKPLSDEEIEEARTSARSWMVTDPIAKLRAMYAAHEAHEGRGDEASIVERLEQVVRECALLEAIPALLDVVAAATLADKMLGRMLSGDGVDCIECHDTDAQCAACWLARALDRLDEVMRD